MPFTADEYPALKAAGLVTITKPVPPKVQLTINRGEIFPAENETQYIDSLNAEIFELQKAIDARLLLITDIQAAP